MTIEKPRDPFSEVVDTSRRWNPEWYTWLTSLSSDITTELTNLSNALANLSNSSGRLSQIKSQVVSSPVGNIDFTGIDNTYDEYELHFYNAQCANNGAFDLQISQNNGVSFDTGISYVYGSAFTAFNTTNSLFAGSGAAGFNYIQITAVHNLGSPWTANGVVRFFTPYTNGLRKPFLIQSYQAHPTLGQSGWNGWGSYFANSNPFNAIRIFNDGGNITGGTFKLYGLQK